VFSDGLGSQQVASEVVKQAFLPNCSFAETLDFFSKASALFGFVLSVVAYGSGAGLNV